MYTHSVGVALTGGVHMGLLLDMYDDLNSINRKKLWSKLKHQTLCSQASRLELALRPILGHLRLRYMDGFFLV